MSTKIQVTVTDLYDLFKVSIARNTEQSFGRLALEWADAADKELTRLKTDIEQYRVDAEKWREANAGEGPTVILKPPISQRFENLVACAHALQDVMDKLRRDAGTEDPFAADPEWTVLASHVDSVLETVRNQK